MNPLLMTPWWNRAGHSSIPVRLFTEINRNLCAAELCGEEESGWNSAWIPRAGQFSLVARSSSYGGMIARERERERGERVWARTAKTRDPDTDRPTDTHYRSGRAETEIEKERERNPIPRITYTALQRISVLLQLFSSHPSLSFLFK